MKINEFEKKLEREGITGAAKDILIKQYITISK